MSHKLLRFGRNDNTPVFTESVYSALISEDSSLMQEVTTVTANDPDENDALVYSIISGGRGSAFPVLSSNVSFIFHYFKYTILTIHSQIRNYLPKFVNIR